jgi:DNA-binding XRE family transcriptional regulator
MDGATVFDEELVSHMPGAPCTSLITWESTSICENRKPFNPRLPSRFMSKSGPRLRGSGRKEQAFLSLLRAVREEAGLSQKELADALGLEQTIVSKVEHGVRRLDLLELDDLCQIVGIPFEEFVRRYRRAAQPKPQRPEG